jgi:hypothetical protein
LHCIELSRGGRFATIDQELRVSCRRGRRYNIEREHPTRDDVSTICMQASLPMVTP